MPGLPAPTFDTVTIAGVDCHTPAWSLTNSHVLRDPAPKDRTNLKLAGVDGRLGRRASKDQRTVGLEFYVVGEVDRLGAPIADPIEGVEANIAYLRDNIYEAAANAFDELTCSVIAADGTTYTGPLQVDDFVAQPGIGSRWVFMQVTLTDGELAAVGS